MGTYTKRTMTTQRFEALSDGVIAIILTIMVFDLKFQDPITPETIADQLIQFIPSFLTYAVSFFTICVFWFHHHQLFHQMHSLTPSILWLGLHWLFWMSLIPFATHFVGTHPSYWQATLLYGLIFFAAAAAFSRLRRAVLAKGLLHAKVDGRRVRSILTKNKVGQILYLLGALSGLASVYLAFLFFIIVPAMYVWPEKSSH